MAEFPEIFTARLWLRAFGDDDAPTVQRLAGNRLVAETTATIPHPYGDGVAEAWIATHEASWIMGRGLVLAIALRETGELVGAIGLNLAPEHKSAELGYWLGEPFWRRGFATEAARAVIDFGFTRLQLERIHAHHFARNVASGRVLEKAGMSVEGMQRAAFVKWGRAEDVRLLAILRREWERARQS